MNSSSSCTRDADGAFGPAVVGCRGNFDFTITFEQYFFSLTPSVYYSSSRHGDYESSVACAKKSIEID